MKNMEEFTNVVLKEIRKMAKEKFEVTTVTKMKNNGIRCTGISVRAKNSNSGLCVFLDELYKKYQDGCMDQHDIADEIYKQIMEHQNDCDDMDIVNISEWEQVKVHVYAKLINAEKNKEQLSTLPHRMFLDLAVVYYLVACDFVNQGIGTVLIHNGLMMTWEQCEETLYQTACENMRTDGNPVFGSMKNILRSVAPEKAYLWESEGFSLDIGAYILTNGRKHYGASEILDRSTLREIADNIGDHFIVLPSSVHEVIIIASCQNSNYTELADMVREINATEVSVEDYLSDHVYVYTGSEEALEIVA